MTGIVFNIQRFSVNDGPGIRTTVFLKGCPLHCKWCHNPESISPGSEIMLREDRCIRCGNCFAICEQHAVRQADGGFATDREICIQCGRCVDDCYSEARVLVGKEMTVIEVLAEVIKDVPFYDQSGGGVTFSGGEPLLQHEFLFSALQACKDRSIHTAVDTSGYGTPEVLEKVSPSVDLFLYDLKTLNDAKHRDFTRVPNRLILENLGRLVEWRKTIIVRIPIIPGINDSLEEIRNIGAYVESLKNIQEIDLLPYHTSGTEKYRRLGLDYPMEYAIQPSPESLEVMITELKKFVPRVVIGG